MHHEKIIWIDDRRRKCNVMVTNESVHKELTTTTCRKFDRKNYRLKVNKTNLFQFIGSILRLNKIVRNENFFAIIFMVLKADLPHLEVMYFLQGQVVRYIK